MICVLIPCHNEEQTIEKVIKAATIGIRSFDHNKRGRILIVNNASTDNTVMVASKALNKYPYIYSEIINEPTLGYGAAIRAGIEHIHNNMPSVNFVVIADGDATYDLSDLNAFKKARDEGNEFVIGTRKYVTGGGIRAIGAKCLSCFGRILSGSKVQDFHCGLRGGDIESLYSLNCQSKGFEYASEMVLKATANQLSIYQFPTAYTPDVRECTHSKSKLNPLTDGLRHIFLIVRFCFTKGLNT